MDRQEIIKVIANHLNVQLSDYIECLGKANDIISALTSAGLTIEQDWKPIDDGAKDGKDCLLNLMWGERVVARWDHSRWVCPNGDGYSPGDPTHYKPISLPEK